MCLGKKRQWTHSSPKPMGCSKSSKKREVYSNKNYLKKQEKYQINNLNLNLKKLGKEERKYPKLI